jgi:uncharacterized protein YmfQ (DUF2313 family)
MATYPSSAIGYFVIGQSPIGGPPPLVPAIPPKAQQSVCGLTGDDYAQVLADLLPRGLAWPRDPAAVIMLTMRGLAEEYARVTERNCDLLAESYPCGSTETLPDWERICGLPDPCTGPLDTLQQRRAAVCGVLGARGGQSAAYFIQLAADHGYDIEITEYTPFRVDLNSVEDPLLDSAWWFTWTISTPEHAAITYFRTDQSAVEEPLASWGDQQLECLILKHAPAHTIPMFEYTQAE